MIKITADSTADLDRYFSEYNVPIMPLIVTLEGKEYLDGVDIDAQMIFDSYDKNRTLPKTAARGIAEYEDFFHDLTADGSEVVHFAVSSELSSSYSNALAAANGMSNVYVVDSKSLSTGIGLLVLKAIDYREQGLNAKEIFDKVMGLVPHVQASFVVDTMEYLHKGGRCSGVKMIVATVLKIHPQIIVKEGKLVVGQKFTGKMAKCLEKYVAAVLKEYTPDTSRIFVTHAHSEPEIVEQVVAQIKELLPDVKEVFTTYAGATITSHCGKGTLGILFINKP